MLLTDEAVKKPFPSWDILTQSWIPSVATLNDPKPKVQLSDSGPEGLSCNNRLKAFSLPGQTCQGILYSPRHGRETISPQLPKALATNLQLHEAS